MLNKILTKHQEAYQCRQGYRKINKTTADALHKTSKFFHFNLSKTENLFERLI